MRRRARFCFFNRRAICLLLALTLSCPATADDGAGDGDDTPAALPPLQLEAQRLETRGNTTHAEGEVEARFEDYKLCAGSILYDRDTGLVRAKGEVRLLQGDSEITGGSAQYNLQTRRGEIAPFDSTTLDRQLRVSGDKADWTADAFSGDNVQITSCPVDSQDWSLNADNVIINNDTRTLETRNAALYLGALPVLYLPYGAFYYGDEKRRGFLEPNLEVDSGSGVGITAPYYLPLADNYDLTITPNYLARHGLELGGEFRFLTEKSHGEVQVATALQDDQGRGRERLEYHYRRGGWRMDLLAENVSDNDYLRDYAEDEDTSVRTLPRRAVLRYEGDRWYASAAAEHFKSLDDTLIAPHRAVPQVEVGGGGGSDRYDWNMSVQHARFVHNTLGGGARSVWNGDARAYHHFGDVAISPGIGGKGVSYNATEKGSDPSYFVPYVRLDAETNSRNAFIKEAHQRDHLQLRAAIVYAPARKRQNSAPRYDTDVREDNSDTLFEWNRFVGDDRASDSQFVAYGASYRQFAGEREWLFLGATQRYYLNDGKIALAQNDSPPPQGFSNVLMNSHLRPDDNWTLSTAAEWNTRQATMERFYAEMHGAFAERKLLHLRYLNDSDESLVIGGAAPLTEWLEVAAQMDYLLDEDHFARSWFGLRVHDSCGCWNLTFTVTDTVVKENDNEVRFSLGIEFVGLGGLGNDYDSLLDNLR